MTNHQQNKKDWIWYWDVRLHKIYCNDLEKYTELDYIFNNQRFYAK